jgi:tellurite resistance protein TehA-like permease
MAVHEVKLRNMTAAWLLPVVSTIVASASGGIVAEIIPVPRDAYATLLTSYVLLGTGLPLALLILGVYFLRLTTYQLPPKEVVVSTFLPLGPLGQGGFAWIQLGKQAQRLFRDTRSLNNTGVYAGDILYVVGFIIALTLFGFGLVWFFFAVATIRQTGRFPFNVGWWGFSKWRVSSFII